jgi:hypothetical protein
MSVGLVVLFQANKLLKQERRHCTPRSGVGNPEETDRKVWIASSAIASSQ